MPTVTARYGGTKVARRALPGVRKDAHETAQSTGANLALDKADTARVLGQVGSQVFGYAAKELDEIVQKERKRAISTELLAAQNAAGKWKTNRFYSKGGVFDQRGMDAQGLPEQVSAEWTKMSGEIAAGLHTDEARQAWHEYSSRFGLDLDNTIQPHVAKERDAFEAGEVDAKLKNIAQTTAAVANDPSRYHELTHTVRRDLGEGLMDIAVHGQNLGWGKDRITAAQSAFQSAVHEGVVDGLVNSQQVDKAQTYYDETQKLFSQDAKDRLKTKLEMGSITERKQKAVDTILAQAPDDVDKQLKIARETLSGELEEKVTDELKVRQNEALNKMRLKREAIGVAAQNHIYNGGSFDNFPQRDQLDVSEAAALQRFEKEQRTKGGSGFPEHSNPNTYAWLTTLAKSADPAMRLAFQKIDLTSVLGQLSESDQKHFVNTQADTRRGDIEKAEARLRNPSFQVDMVNQALGKMGYDSTPRAPGAAGYDPKNDPQMMANVNEFRRSVREAVQRKEAQTGKDVTDEDMQSIVDRLSISVGRRVIKQGKGADWNPNYGSTYAPAFAYQVAQAQVTSTKDIPYTERERIIRDELLNSKAAKAPGFKMPTGAELERIILRLFNERLAETRKDR